MKVGELKKLIRHVVDARSIENWKWSLDKFMNREQRRWAILHLELPFVGMRNKGYDSRRHVVS